MSNFNVLFDLDGTLTDPQQGIVTCFEYALNELGYSLPDRDELCLCIGPPLSDSFARLLDTTDRDLVDRAIGFYRDRYAKVGLFENKLYPQIPAVLVQIRAAGFRTYVATSKAQIYATQIVTHFNLSPLFDRIYGSELDGKYSTKAELIERILRLENLSSAHTVMVGDRAYDTIGAKQHGLYTIGVSYGYGSIVELTSAGTDIIVAEAAEILPILIMLRDRIVQARL